MIIQERRRAIGNTGYTVEMAKVMVSLPDDVLHSIDTEAERRGTTRSGLIRALAEESARARSIRRAERMNQILQARGPAVGHGGNVAEVLKQHRPDH